MGEILLQMKNLSKQFNGITVLDRADLEVKNGEVHILIGENGAGKSTLMKILSGAYRKDSGDIFLNGKKVLIRNPKDAIDQGISIIYQELTLVPEMSVYENVFMGKEFGKGGFVDHKKTIEECQKWLELVGLDVSPRALIKDLSIAEQQMVEIAKALTFDLKILVLDEPTASLTEREIIKLFDLIDTLKKRSIGIIYISHRMKELFQIGDRCTVMRDGQTIKTMDLKDTTVDQLTYLMVGREIDLEKTENPYRTDEVVLSVRELSYRKQGHSEDFLKNISFDLKKGEILGFSGLVGSGRTELAKNIIGAYMKSNGEIKIDGIEIKGNSISNSIKAGVVYLSEDRKNEGLVLIHSVGENISLPNLDLFGKTFLSRKKREQLVSRKIRDLRIKVRDEKQETGTLSGGNQQKVVIARWLPKHAKVYIFDEPTRGIDVGARAEIYNIMKDILKGGSSIIMISSDMNELMAMSDRVAVMKDGELLTILENKEELTPENVLNYMLLGKEGGNGIEIS